MKLNEYLQFALAKAVARLAEDDGVRIVDEKPRPKLVEPKVVTLRADRATPPADSAA
jgi:hypothetical protein